MTDPVFSDYFPNELAVEGVKVQQPILLRNVEVLAAVLDEVVADAPKGISEIKPLDMDCLLICLGILENFLEDFYVFSASIDALKKSLLVTGIDVLVANHEIVKSLCFYGVVGLSKAA